MANAISVRLDKESFRALRKLEAAGYSRSEAIRTALVWGAGQLAARQALKAEAAALEADDHDRAEMQAVAALMEDLRAPG